jgi:hypothetical protein
MITSGAAVVGARIAAFVAIYVAKLGKDNKPAVPQPQAVVVNLIGSKTAIQLNVNPAVGLRLPSWIPCCSR